MGGKFPEESFGLRCNKLSRPPVDLRCPECFVCWLFCSAECPSVSSAVIFWRCIGEWNSNSVIEQIRVSLMYHHVPFLHENIDKSTFASVNVPLMVSL